MTHASAMSAGVKRFTLVKVSIDFSANFANNLAMDIQALSTDMAQGRVQEEIAVRVQAMALNMARDNAEDLDQLMNPAQVITDPARGNYLNILA